MREVKLRDAARFASKHANSQSARRFATHVVPEVVRPARIIWNQAIGALFLVLGIAVIFKIPALYHDLETDPKSAVALAICGVFVIIMFSFGISSFLRARRIAQRVHRP